MGSLGGIALLGIGGLLGLVGLAKLGRVLGGKRLPWLWVVLVAGGLAAAPFAVGVLLDRFGVVERGVVADRRETVGLTFNGGWRPAYWVTVKYPGAPGGMHRLRADQRSYDQVAFGDPVDIRFLPILRSVTRLELTPTGEWLRAFPWFDRALIGAAVVLVLAGLALFGGRGAAGSIRKIGSVALIAAGGYGGYRDLAPFAGTGADRPAAARGAGTIKRMWRVASVYPPGGAGDRPWRLAKPYRLVAIEFTPARARGPVTIVDAVDDESVTQLAVGDQVPVRYPADEPRRARLDAGRRTFAAANRRDDRLAGLVCAGVVAGLLALRVLLGGQRR